MFRRSFLIASVLLCAACIVRIPGDWNVGETTTTLFGTEVRYDDGVMYADDVELPHHRWEAFSGTLADVAALDLRVATGDIDVSGAPGDGFSLELLIYSERPEDGAGVFEDGQLRAHSATDGKVLVNAVRGSIPAHVDLFASSGTGELNVGGMVNQGELRLTAGTGQARAVDCSVGRLDLDSGTARLELERVTTSLLELATGTGDVRMRACQIELLRLESGTGDVRIEESALGVVRGETGTGDIHILDSQVGEVDVSSGTGDVVLSGAGTWDTKVSASLGTGDVVRDR